MRARRALALALTAVLGWAAAAAAQVTYVAFGDSITAGFHDDPGKGPGYPPRLETLLQARGIPATVINQGVDGETTTAGLTRISTVLISGVTAVLLMEGTNDVNAKVSIETITTNLALMAQKAEQVGIAAVHATVIPRLPAANTDGNNLVTGELAGAIRELAWSKGRQLVDPFEVFLNLTPGAIPNDYFDAQGDQLHPNGAGYDLLASTFADVLSGVDHVPPVTGLIVPADKAQNVAANSGVTVDLYDFGAGIDLNATQLLINGNAVSAHAAGDSKKLELSYQPPQPLAGVVVLHLHSQDLASPPNVVDRDIASFIIEGTTFLVGDLNRDGRVDGMDLLILALAFGAHRYDPNYNINADFNGDGIVDGLDLALLASNFGKHSF
jgi:lysophospholipase L1-like esterase